MMRSMNPLVWARVGNRSDVSARRTSSSCAIIRTLQMLANGCPAFFRRWRYRGACNVQNQGRFTGSTGQMNARIRWTQRRQKQERETGVAASPSAHFRQVGGLFLCAFLIDISSFSQHRFLSRYTRSRDRRLDHDTTTIKRRIFHPSLHNGTVHTEVGHSGHGRHRPE
jgi:hypothetical protein